MKMMLGKRSVLLSALVSSMLLVTACGGSDDKDSGAKTPTQPTPATEKLTGTAATGAALANADIEVTNKAGVKKTVKAGVDGKFSIDVEQGAPYIVKATKGDVALYSYAAAAGNVNVTQLTTQAVLAASGDAVYGDAKTLADIYSQWATIASNSEKITTAVDKSAKEIVANLKTVFDASGYTAAKGYPDIFKTAFDANSKGLDKVLDSVKIDLDANSSCTGTGTAFNCNFKYKVNGETFNWNYNVDTNGITIDLDSTAGNTGGIPTGNYNLTVTTTIMGSQTPAVTIKNIPKPANQNEFCGSSDVTGQLPDGEFKINSCSFNGTTGNINATINTQGVTFTYDVKYVYSAA